LIINKYLKQFAPKNPIENVLFDVKFLWPYLLSNCFFNSISFRVEKVSQFMEMFGCQNPREKIPQTPSNTSQKELTSLLTNREEKMW